MRLVLVAAVALLAAWGPAPAPAQTIGGAGGAGGAGGTSAAAAAASAAGGAGGKAVARNNATINGGAGNASNTWDAAASAIAPSFGVAGPCTGSAASVAGEVKVFGLSFGGVNMDKACQSEHLGNLNTIGERIGFEVMCDDSQFRKAAARAHYACSADQTAAPIPEPPAPPQPDHAGRDVIDAQCARYTPSQRSHYPECHA